MRTRTVVCLAHSYQWLGSFGNPGNGQYRNELRRAIEVIERYLVTRQVPKGRALLRLNDQYGTGTVLSDLAGLAYVTRGKDYTVLEHPLLQARLHLPPDQFQHRPESQNVRSLYDCPQVPVGSEGVTCRVIVATHPAGKKKSPLGITRAGLVYELFFTTLPQQAFTACDAWAPYVASAAGKTGSWRARVPRDSPRGLTPGSRCCSVASSVATTGTTRSVPAGAVGPTVPEPGYSLGRPIWPASRSSAAPPTGSAVHAACGDRALFITFDIPLLNQTASPAREGPAGQQLLS